MNILFLLAAFSILGSPLFAASAEEERPAEEVPRVLETTCDLVLSQLGAVRLSSHLDVPQCIQHARKEDLRAVGALLFEACSKVLRLPSLERSGVCWDITGASLEVPPGKCEQKFLEMQRGCLVALKPYITCFDVAHTVLSGQGLYKTFLGEGFRCTTIVRCSLNLKDNFHYLSSLIHASPCLKGLLLHFESKTNLSELFRLLSTLPLKRLSLLLDHSPSAPAIDFCTLLSQLPQTLEEVCLCGCYLGQVVSFSKTMGVRFPMTKSLHLGYNMFSKEQVGQMQQILPCFPVLEALFLADCKGHEFNAGIRNQTDPEGILSFFQGISETLKTNPRPFVLRVSDLNLLPEQARALQAQAADLGVTLRVTHEITLDE